MTSKIFSALQAQAQKNRFEKVGDRLEKLKKLQLWIRNHETEIEKALYADFKKPAFESQISEIIFVLSELKFFIKHLKCWMKDKSVGTPLSLLGHKSFIRYDNKGVVLIISPWNYPFMLTVSPLIAALAAGNTIIIKPSELTTHVSDLILKMCSECFNSQEVVVELGDKEKTTELLSYNLDHVFFTGSTPVGKIIAQSCADRLIPYTLELGGKSPAIVDQNVNIKDVVQKIYWGKFLNRGQTCVAPDSLYVHKKIKKDFLQAYQEFENSLKQESASAIITDRHAQRLKNLTGQQLNLELTQTLLIDLETQNSDQFGQIQKEEIFGPVATVNEFTDLVDIQKHYKENINPLSLYVFSEDQDFIDSVLRSFPSGGVGINTLMVQLANHHLPFGGVGSSGQGRYHGHFGFLEFSHQRAVVEQKYFKFILETLFPPYTDLKKKLIQVLKKVIT